MLWPRPRSLSAPCVRHVSAMCPPCVCLESALAAPPALVPHVPLCLSLVSALCVFTMCPPCARSLAAQIHHVSSSLDFVRSWHHEVKSFLSIMQPTTFILHALQFPWQSFWAPQFGLCKRALCLKNCLGSMLV